MIDKYDLYAGHVDKEVRSIINICFHIGDNLLEQFILEAENEGLLHLRGYKTIGGIRACLYNSMPIEGAKALADFMEKFAKNHKKY